MNFCLFEDSGYKNLYPLTYLRPVYELKCGALSLKEKAEITFGEISLHARSELAKIFDANNTFDADTVYLNGRITFKELAGEIKNMTGDFALVSGDTLLAFRGNLPALKDVINAGKVVYKDMLGETSAKEVKEGFTEIKYPWDLVKNIAEINSDLNHICKGKAHLINLQSETAQMLNEPHVYLSQTAKVLPGSVFDASGGKIYVDEGAAVEPFCYVRGPVYIGKNAVVKSGTRLYGPCVIGKESRVAGEISGSIFHGYVNKQHEGFAGNSYFSEFVNLGADTVTSNLKNNYSKVRVKLRDGDMDTDMQFLGTIAGDHAKTGINTMLNTGTIAGIFANIFGGGFPDKYIENFAWYDAGGESTKYRIEEALKTARTVMARRNVELTAEYEDVVRQVYEA